MLKLFPIKLTILEDSLFGIILIKLIFEYSKFEQRCKQILRTIDHNKQDLGLKEYLQEESRPRLSCACSKKKKCCKKWQKKDRRCKKCPN